MVGAKIVVLLYMCCTSVLLFFYCCHPTNNPYYSAVKLKLYKIFNFNSINHSNSTCKNVLRVKLLSVNSTFAAKYQYLSFKFGLTEADWYTSLNHLLGKVKKKIALLHPQLVLCGVKKDLCAMRDNTSLCDIADKHDIVVLINDICIN